MHNAKNVKQFFQRRMDNIWFCKLLFLLKINAKTNFGMVSHERVLCFCAGEVQQSNFTYYACYAQYCISGIFCFNDQNSHHIHTFYIFFVIFLVVLHLSGRSAITPSHMSTVNQFKSCASFPCPQYWVVCFLCQWARQGRYPSRCDENQRTFQSRFVITQKTLCICP